MRQKLIMKFIENVLSNQNKLSNIKNISLDMVGFDWVHKDVREYSIYIQNKNGMNEYGTISFKKQYEDYFLTHSFDRKLMSVKWFGGMHFYIVFKDTAKELLNNI